MNFSYKNNNKQYQDSHKPSSRTHSTDYHSEGESTSTSTQKSSFRLVPLQPGKQFKRSGVLMSPFSSDDSRRQPRSVLPLNMIVSDVVSRDRSTQVDHNFESSNKDISECNNEISQLLKIKNNKKRFRPIKDDKVIRMIQEKHAKMYPSHSLVNGRNSEHNTASVNSQFKIRPLRDNLTTPVRQQCNSFSQLYGRQCNRQQAEDNPTTPVRQQCNSFSQLYGRQCNRQAEDNLTTPITQQCNSFSQLYGWQNNRQQAVNCNDQRIISRVDLLNPGSCNSDDKQSISNKQKEFIFNPVIVETISYKSFENMFEDKIVEEKPTGESTVCEWCNDSDSCESLPSMDLTTIKRTRVEKMLTVTVTDFTNKFIHCPRNIECEE